MQEHRSGRNRGNARLRGKVGKDRDEVGKHQRPNPKEPHIMTRSRCRALPCRQWGVFAHLAQGAHCSPFHDSIQCHFGEPFPGSADAAGSVLPGLQGPHGTPFISHLILHPHDLLSSLAPHCTESYLRQKHILFIVIYPEQAHNTCMYLQMFNSPVEWFARDFNRGVTFKQ